MIYILFRGGHLQFVRQKNGTALRAIAFPNDLDDETYLIFASSANANYLDFQVELAETFARQYAIYHIVYFARAFVYSSVESRQLAESRQAVDEINENFD